MPNHNQQLNEQFDRIYNLLDKPKGLESAFSENTEGQSIYLKQLYLQEIFTVKNDKGEYILEQGNLDNPAYLKKLDEFKVLSKDPETIPAFVRIDQEVKSILLENLRQLFCENCILTGNPKVDTQKIENLKLINW